MIKGFEKDVGTKTSFYGFTVNTMKNSLISYSNLGFTSVPQGQVRLPLTVGAIVSQPASEGWATGFPSPSPVHREAVPGSWAHAMEPLKGRIWAGAPCGFRWLRTTLGWNTNEY